MKLGMNCKVKTAAILAVTLPCLFVTSAAHAARATSSMNVKMQVINGCALNVANMDFGIITHVTGTETAKSYVTVECNRFAGVNLSFAPTYSAANTSRNSTLTSAAGGKINFSMVLEGSSGNLFSGQTGYTYIDGQLAATPGAAPGVYQSTETLYVLY